MPLNSSLNLPLKTSPYKSRVSNNYIDKNYFLLAFNPGYALQASELNEIQELFYINQSLSLSYPNNWLTKGFGRAGFWEGAVPHDPGKIIISQLAPNGINYSFNLQIQEGWYLFTDRSSNLSFWIYNLTTYTTRSFTTSFSSSTDVEYIGFFIRTKTVNCCQSEPCPPNQDLTLRDNSSGGYSEFTCGSSRIGIEFYNETGDDGNPFPSLRNDPSAIESVPTLGQFNFCPLLRLEVYNNITNPNRIKFYDSQPAAIIT